MMKYDPIILITLFLWTGCSHSREQNYNGWPNYFLKGEVKSIHSSCYDTDSSGNPTWKWRMGDEWQTFDRQGNILTEELALTGEAPDAKTEYIYKEERLQESHYYYAGKLTEKTLFEYTDAVLVKALKYNGEENLLSTLWYEYKEDKITSVKVYAADDQRLISHTTWQYKGNILTEKQVTYPQARTFTREVYDKKGEVIVKTEGGEIQDDLYEATESSTYTYIYDERGNWIQCTAFENGEASYIQKRIIEYF